MELSSLKLKKLSIFQDENQKIDIFCLFWENVSNISANNKFLVLSFIKGEGNFLNYFLIIPTKCDFSFYIFFYT